MPIKSAMKLVIELIGHLKGSLCYSLLSFCYFLFLAIIAWIYVSFMTIYEVNLNFKSQKTTNAFISGFWYFGFYDEQNLGVWGDRRHQIIKGATVCCFANGVHFPFAIVAVDFCHNHCGMTALCRQIVASDFAIV